MRLITPACPGSSRRRSWRPTTGRWTRSSGRRRRSPRPCSSWPATWPSTCATTSDVTAVGLWLSAEHDALPGRVTAAVRKIITTQRAREQLLPLVSRYAAAKAAREVLDHGDQVALAARIASRHPEVGAAERARYQVVLLDEYQDTSTPSWCCCGRCSAAGTR